MKLTERELEFLTRLMGNHMRGGNEFVYNLYLKLHKSAVFHGMGEDTLEKPLNLVDMAYAREGYDIIFLDVVGEDFE